MLGLPEKCGGDGTLFARTVIAAAGGRTAATALAALAPFSTFRWRTSEAVFPEDWWPMPMRDRT